MNKKKFAQQCRKDGWRVPNPSNWEFVEDREINGVATKVYKLTVTSPNKETGEVEVAVADDGKKNNEDNYIERVIPIDWDLQLESFTDRLRDYLDEQEKKEGVFAITTETVKEEDEIAEIMLYNERGNEVVAERHIVICRKGVFQMKKIN